MESPILLSPFVRTVGGKKGRDVARVQVPCAGLPLESWDLLPSDLDLSPACMLAVLPLETLRRIGVISGRRCSVSCVSQRTSAQRVCTVIAAEWMVGDDQEVPEIAFISPMLAHALEIGVDSEDILSVERTGYGVIIHVITNKIGPWRRIGLSTKQRLLVLTGLRSMPIFASLLLEKLRFEYKLPVARSVTFAVLLDGSDPPAARLSGDALRHCLVSSAEHVVSVGDVLPSVVAKEVLCTADLASEETKDGDETRIGPKSAAEISTYSDIVFFRVESVTTSKAPHISATGVILNKTTRVVQGPAVGGRRPPGLLAVCRYRWRRELRPMRPPFPIQQKVVDALQPIIRASQQGVFASVLLHGPKGSGKMRSAKAAAEANGYAVSYLNCSEAATNKAVIVKAVARAKLSSPSVLLMSDASSLASMLADHHSSVGNARPRDMSPAQDPLSQLDALFSNSVSRNSSTKWNVGWDSQKTDTSVVLIAICDEDVEGLSAQFRCLFTYEIAVPAPDGAERRQLVDSGMRSWGLDGTMSEYVSTHLAGRTVDELLSVLRDAAGRAMRESVDVGKRHVEIAVSRMQAAAGSDAAKAVKVAWEDVGGLSEAKEEIINCIELPLKNPELLASSLQKRSGLLLYGPPGTGKTLLAKAIASECGCSFLSVKGPEVMNMYVGESERNLREIFSKARAARPCVVFFDELDALVPSRGRGSDSGGVSDRIVSQLLSEVDGLGTDGGEVFVIGATNRPDLVDGDLLRPGRFDRLVFIGTPDSREAQLKVLNALTRKFKFEGDVDLAAVLDRCPPPPLISGADLYGLASQAWLMAAKRLYSQDEESGRPSEQRRTDLNLFDEDDCHVNDGDDDSSEKKQEVLVSMNDLMSAAPQVTPSLTKSEIDRYLHMKDRFEGETS